MTTEKTYHCDRRGKIVKLLKEIRVTFFNHSCNDLATHLSFSLCHRNTHTQNNIPDIHEILTLCPNFKSPVLRPHF